MFLTLGIVLGSAWAYYELGWGGWWFWDPVENASFMPWLVGTALLHSLAVTEKRGSFRAWTVLLAIAAFSLCLLGTFLVRSGVLPAYPAGRLRATNRRRAMCQPVVAQAGGPWENGVFRCAARCGGHPGGTCPAGRGTAAPVLREPRPRCRSRPASAAEGTETGGLRQADRQK